MPHWLEREEREKGERDAEAARRAAISKENEKSMAAALEPFRDLCSRVNNVRPHSLSVFQLQVSGTKPFDSYTAPRGIYKTSGTDWMMFRGIRINCTAEATTLEAVTIKFDHYWNDMQGPWDSTTDLVQHRANVTESDLKRWSESNMRRVIDWLLVESEEIKHCLPGSIVRI
jgi:hypothetical protein